MTAKRAVPTRAIRAAVRGREAEVVAELGVPWRGGAPHIRCPYPDHDDRNPSWRWDAVRARAHCTCITGSDSVFDIGMKVRGLDFAAAKLFVAETLGRHDLIRIRDGERPQASDAASLLRPPAGERADALVRAYLGHRLGIRPEDVPMPATPIAGWRALAYFDPPATQDGRPQHGPRRDHRRGARGLRLRRRVRGAHGPAAGLGQRRPGRGRRPARVRFIAHEEDGERARV